VSTELMSLSQQDLAEVDVEAKLAQTASNLKAIKTFVASAMVEDVDYGKIPGTGDKPTLLKPGAEKLDGLFSCYPQFEFLTVMENPETGLAFYRVKASLISRITGRVLGEGVGSCSSYESKYRWRWVPANSLSMLSHEEIKALPSKGGAISEFAFGVEKKETSGQYGKPAEYWKKFEDAIAAGTARQIKRKTRKGAMMDAWEIDETVYRQANPDLMDVWNTVLKIAQKRAHVAAALTLGAVSDLFTQDLEDYIDGDFTAVASGNGKKEPVTVTTTRVPAPAVTATAEAVMSNIVLASMVNPVPEAKVEAPSSGSGAVGTTPLANPLKTVTDADPMEDRKKFVMKLVNGKHYKTPNAVWTKMAELKLDFDPAQFDSQLQVMIEESKKAAAKPAA